MKMKKKPGPKPKLAAKKARGKTLSFPAPMADYLDSLDSQSELVQELVNQSPDYQKWIQSHSS